MNTMDEIENFLVRLSLKELIDWCMINNLLCRDRICSSCSISMVFLLIQGIKIITLGGA